MREGFLMFKLNFRIITDFEELSKWSAEEFNREGDLEGFFEINIQGNTYGYYHSRPLGEDEAGFDLLTGWFQRLLKVIALLDGSNDYVAVSDIESYNSWIEFVKIGENLCVSVIEYEKKDGLSDVITSKFDKVVYPSWKEVSISINEFRRELIQKSELYIKEVISINKDFVNSIFIRSLHDLLKKVNI